MESISLKLRGSGMNSDDLREVVFTSDTSNIIKHNISVNKTWQNCVGSNVSENVITAAERSKACLRTFGLWDRGFEYH
jgi:hypothetical protein